MNRRTPRYLLYTVVAAVLAVAYIELSMKYLKRLRWTL